MSDLDKHLDIEEDFFSIDKKSHRKLRKELSAKDRSKYKKTDRDKQAPNQDVLDKFSKEGYFTGRVISIIADSILVEDPNGEVVCHIKGSLKQEKTEKKNLVAVGDIVIFEKTTPSTGVIVHIKPRYSILSRADNLRRNKEQIIAVNIDILFIVCSAVMPGLKPSLIDRYIIAARQGNMHPIIVINKIDLLKQKPEIIDEPSYQKQLEIYAEFSRVYSKLDIPIIEISCTTGEGLDNLRAAMEKKTSVFSGQSGVGKTSLINKILGTNLKTAEIVAKTYKGSHTTTTATLIPLDHESFCIDTPGIRSFGIWQITQQDLDQYFKEFLAYKHLCKYQNCAHLQEPNCGVKEAVEEGLISPLRYQSYSDLKLIPDDIWR